MLLKNRWGKKRNSELVPSDTEILAFGELIRNILIFLIFLKTLLKLNKKLKIHPLHVGIEMDNIN